MTKTFDPFRVKKHDEKIAEARTEEENGNFAGEVETRSVAVNEKEATNNIENDIKKG